MRRKKKYQHTEDNPSPLRRVRLRGHVRARPTNTTQCTQSSSRTTRTTAEIRDSSRRRRSTAPCTTTLLPKQRKLRSTTCTPNPRHRSNGN
ncbi:unnamed protein product, partial [Ixodes persulcatus]